MTIRNINPEFYNWQFGKPVPAMCDSCVYRRFDPDKINPTEREIIDAGGAISCQIPGWAGGCGLGLGGSTRLLYIGMHVDEKIAAYLKSVSDTDIRTSETARLAALRQSIIGWLRRPETTPEQRALSNLGAFTIADIPTRTIDWM